MSRTLFKYIFWDLFRIFMMANGALAGIMSFAGLLKPLTQNGLDAAQVGKLLTYFTPSMMAYSFPIAALFATTVVYGRLSADNEVTAARACGIGHLAIALPAMVLGLIVALISLLFLSYVVPQFTLKVEKVIYSNLAALVQNKIEKNHQMRFGSATVFAQRAQIIPPDPADPFVQRVVLETPTILTYQKRDKVNPDYLIPEEFWMASKATLYIRTDANGDNAELTAALDGGMKFPRKAVGGWEGGVRQTQFGPIALPSLIRENTKFMDINKLKELDADKRKSKKVAGLRLQFVAEAQEGLYLDEITDGLKKNNQFVFKSGRDLYTLSRTGNETVGLRGDRLFVTSTEGRTIRLSHDRNGVPALNAHAAEARLRIRADVKARTLSVSAELQNLVMHEPDGDIERGSIMPSFTVEMPLAIAKLSAATVEEFASADPNAHTLRRHLMRELLILKNDIASEMHSRAAFAASCLILVLVGCSLGMMFRSGNFLSAFALSFIPALMCITLIVAGQRTSGNFPGDFWNYRDPLALGISLIWSGNLVVLVLGVGLLWRLHRS